MATTASRNCYTYETCAGQAALIGSNATVSPGATSPVAYVVGNTMPPRDPNNDTDEDDEEDDVAEGDEDLEPAVIREPDKDE